MPNLKPEAKVTLILGKRGTGKSFQARNQLIQYDNYVIFDTLGEYSEGIVFFDIDKLIEFWLHHFENFKIIYQPLNPVDEFDAICRLVWLHGNMAFLVEELDTFCTPYNIIPSFANIIQRGRHRNINFIGVSQRPFGINRIISSQAKHIISFQQSEPRDIQYLSAYIGEAADHVNELEQFQYIDWQDGDYDIIDGYLPDQKEAGEVESIESYDDVQGLEIEEKILDNENDFEDNIDVP